MAAIGGGDADRPPLREQPADVATVEPAGHTPTVAAGSPQRRRRRVVAGVAAGAALMSVGGLIGATLVKSPEQQRAEAAPPATTLLTSTVEQRVVRSTVVTRGTVTAARRIDVTPASAAGADIALVTAVQTQVGAEAKAGDVLLAVSGRPLMVLPGAVPAYRDMRPGDEGDDITEFQAALRRLGHYHGGDRKGYFGAATKAAVRRLYEKAGFATPDTGGPGGLEDQAALRAAGDAVTAAQQDVDSLKARIAAGTEPSPAPGEPTLREQLAAAKETLRRAKLDQSNLIAHTGPMMPLAEVAFMPGFPVAVVAVNGRVGDVLQAPLITLAAGKLNVVARLAPDQASLIKESMDVEIVSESLGETIRGVVTKVGAVTTGSGEDGSAGAPYVPVTAKPAKKLASTWNGLDVRVSITAAQTDGEVLVVPLSAVSAAADGKTVVTVVGADGGRRRVEVRAGVSGDGFVEVLPVGGDLAAGDEVVVGR